MTLIVGKGLHSANKEAVIKPCFENYLQGKNIYYEIPRENEGRLVIGLPPKDAG